MSAMLNNQIFTGGYGYSNTLFYSLCKRGICVPFMFYVFDVRSAWITCPIENVLGIRRVDPRFGISSAVLTLTNNQSKWTTCHFIKSASHRTSFIVLNILVTTLLCVNIYKKNIKCKRLLLRFGFTTTILV